MPTLDLGIDGLDDARRIGRGGFATVYAARDLHFDRWVAVKILDLVDEAGHRRFDREIRIMGRLSRHAHVVTPYRAGYTQAGQPFLVMELVEGGSLLDLVRRAGPLDWELAIDYVLPIADALGHAHERGIHHRDVKPANILIADGVPQLSDFGIAAIQDGHSTSEVALSLHYSPPEAFNGAEGPRDHRSDLYSLAATLYAVIAGRPPFHRDDGDQGALMRRIETERPPPIDGIPDRLNLFFERALAKDPGRRPADADALADELRVLRYGADATTAPLLFDGPRSPARPVPSESVPADDRTPVDDHDLIDPPPAPPHDQRNDRTNPAGGRGAASTYRQVAAGSIIVFALLAAGLFTLVRLSDPATSGGAGDGAGSPGPGSTQSSGRQPNAVADLGLERTVEDPVTSSTAPLAPPRVYTQGEAVWDVIALPDGRLAAAADSAVKVWDPDDLTVETTAFLGHAAPVHTMMVLADGRIASAAGDGTIGLWSPDEPDATVAVEQGHAGQIQDLAQLPDGPMASAGLNESLRIWSLADRDEVETLGRPYTDVWSLEVLDDGRLATGSGDHLIRIMDASAPDEPPLVLGGHDSVVIDLAVLPDGRLASAALDSTVRIWDPAGPGDDSIVYRGHSSPVQAVVGLPDGRVASAGAGLIIHVWDPDQLDAEPLVLDGHVDAVTSLEVLADGRLASGSADGTVRVWDLGITPPTAPEPST